MPTTSGFRLKAGMTASTDNLLQKVCSCLQDEVRPYLDRLTLVEYSIDESNEAFTIDDLGNKDSGKPPRRGNDVNYYIDNLTSKRGNAGGKGQKSESRRAETVRDYIHPWPASSTGACWNTAERTGEKVKTVNYIRWLSVVS